MYILTKIENKLINRINEILHEFKDYEQPFINNNGDIIIKNKLIRRKTNDSSILTNILEDLSLNCTFSYLL